MIINHKSEPELQELNSQNNKKCEWLNVKDLSEYLPTHPARQTIYGWTSSKKIPFYKRGKNVFFNREEIDCWLHSSFRSKTIEEIELDAKNYKRRSL